MAKKLLYGVGVNDADYPTRVHEERERVNGKRVQKVIWRCQIFTIWCGMIRRCYSEAFKKMHPTYIGCFTCTDWHRFSTFRLWVLSQDWEGKQLDKDILIMGNKEYSPETCVFVTKITNSFVVESDAKRGDLMIGVSLGSERSKKKFKAACGTMKTGERKHLGSFDTELEAHQTWLAFKLEQAYILAAQQTDERVAQALIDRYENYKEYYGKTK